MPGSYLAHGGVPHAQTMLRYHQDGRRTSTTLMIVFAVAFGFEAFMFLTTSSVPFAFGSGFALVMTGAGAYLRTRHGIKARRWAETLERWERIRKDRLIHARTLKGFEL